MKKIAILLLAALMAALPACAAAAMGRIALQDDAQTHNAVLAAKKIHELSLAPGGSFSFNETIGPRTEENGFVPALNGRGVTVVGGGVAQAASALYLALKNLAPGSVSFDELSFYGDRYSGAYVESGDKAVLVDYNAGLDFRFTNLTGSDMRIVMGVQDGSLMCGVEASGASCETAAAAPRSDRSGVTAIPLTDPFVIENASLAAGSVSDITLAPGDVFSFNEIVGPCDAGSGYIPAPDGSGAIIPGGGADVVASALWLLIQDRADVVIVEKSTYGSRYCQSYVSGSADAIHTDPAAGVDFAFRYTGPDTLTLYAAVEDGILYAAIQQG